MCLVCAAAMPARAAEGPAAKPEAEGPLRFRRVLAPMSEMRNWASGRMKYLPIDAKEFERLLGIVERPPAAGQTEVLARPIRAQYEARLGSGNRLEGTAVLEIAQTARSPVMMPLEPCSLAIEKARWGDAESPPAVLGLGGNGRLCILVERPGQLRIHWSLAGRRNADDSIDYRLELPDCPVTALSVELPESLAPTVDRGVVAGSEEAAKGVRRWRVELGGNSRVQLRTVAREAQPQASQLVLLRQSTSYDLSSSGIDVTAQLRLEAHRAPLVEVPLLVEPPLRLISAQLGERAVGWREGAPKDKRPGALVLRLPEPLREAGGVLRLRAAAPLVADRSYRLPRILAEGFFWREGSAKLFIAPELSLDEIRPAGCRLAGPVEAAASGAGESLRLECFSPDATLEITLSSRQASVEAVSGVSTTLGGGKMTSRVVTDFRAAEGAEFSLAADVARSWTIDSVESLPADVLEDWQLESKGRSQRLVVRLARPLVPRRPVRLVVVARRIYASPGQNLGIETLVPLRFHVSPQDKRLVVLRAANPDELISVDGDTACRVNPQSLRAAELDLFAEPPGDLLFRDDSTAGELEISLATRKPSYAATIRAEASVVDGLLQESHVIACEPPRAGQIDHVVVQFSRRRDPPPRWSLAGEEDNQFTARLVPQPPGPEGGPGETWEISLRRPRGTPLELRAVREVKLSSAEPVSLVSLPEAICRDATLVVRSLGRRVRIRNNGLTPVATPPAPPGQYQTARATYRYDSARDVTKTNGPTLIVEAQDAQPSAAVWAWHCELRSQCAVNGAANHYAAYRLEAAGGGRLRLTLPEGVGSEDFRGLWINGRRAAPSVRDDNSPRSLWVELPPGDRFTTLTVHFTTAGHPLEAIGQLTPPMPEIDCPVLARHWSVWLPPGFETADYLPGRESSPDRRLGWRERLFGLLGRQSGQPVFHPLRAGDWKAVWRDLSGLFREGTDSWTDDPNGPSAPRPAAAGESSGATGLSVDPGLPLAEDVRGWNVYRLAIPSGEHFGLTVCRTATQRMRGWLVCLLLIGLAMWSLTNRPVVPIALTAVSGVLAAIVPVVWVPVASGALLGSVVGLAAVILKNWRRPRLPQPAAEDADELGLSTTITAALPFGAPVLLAAVLGLAGSASGAEPDKPTQPPAYSVFIPIDERQQPVGGKYYLPEPFYERLHRRAAERTEKPEGCLITDATYRVSLSRETASQRLVLDQLTADFSLQVFGAASRVRIPLRRDEAKLLPGETLLDGRPIQPEWEPDGRALSLEITGAGEYRLELSLRPTTVAAAGAPGFDLTIPRLPASRLEMTVPAGAPPPEVPSAFGAVRFEQEPRRLVAALGPSGRLTVRWQDGVPGAARPAVDVEQLLWLRILPGSVLVDAKLKLHVAAGQLTRLQLVTDPGLQMLPLTGPDAPTVQVQRLREQPQRIHLQWARPVTDNATVEARFLWTDASSLGNLRLPKLEVADLLPTRYWLGVSVAPALDYQVPPLSRLEALPVPEFMASWGAADATPQFACRLPSAPSDWSIATRPRRCETSTDETLAVVADLRSAEVRYHARLTATTGSALAYRIAAPRELEVERVSLLADGVQRVARWSRDSIGAIHVFLTGPVSGMSDLTVRGTMPLPDDRRLALPTLRIDDATTRSSIIQIFRRPTVLVDILQATGLAEFEDPADDLAAVPEGRLVKTFRPQGNAAVKAVLSIKRNRPAGRAEQITRLVCEDGAWKAVVDCLLQLDRGAIDEIAIDAPPSWPGPYQVTPATVVKVNGTAEERRQLVLDFRSPLTGQSACRVSGPLELYPGSRLTLPEVNLRRLAPLRRLVVLPKEAQGRPIAWRTEGLRDIALPEGKPDPTVSAYEIVGDAWRIELEPATSEQISRVSTADVRIAWQPDGTCRGTAALEVRIQEALECPLILPSDARLLGVSIDGLPVDPTAAGSGVWQLALRPAANLQRIEVLFTAGPGIELPGGESSQAALPPTVAQWGNRRVFRAPKLGDLPVDRTIWTIAGPPALGDAAATDAERLDRDTAAKPPAASMVAAWQSSVDGSYTVTRWEGPAESLSIEYPSPETDAWRDRLAVLAVISLLTLAAAVVVRFDRLRQWLARWPYACLAALGVAWWLWLAPSVIGLVIALAAMIRQFVPRPKQADH